MYIYEYGNQWGIPHNKIRGIILHFFIKKPWVKTNYFYKEWFSCYVRANDINFEVPVRGHILKPSRIFYYSEYLTIRERIVLKLNFNRIWFFLVFLYYKLVFFCETKFPKSFSILKKIKAFIKNLGKLESSLVFLQSYEDELKDYQKYFIGKVLNAGSGYRDITGFIKGKVYNLDLANSPNAEKIDIAGSILKIPIKDDFFDSIICNAVLEHVSDPNKALSEMYRVLKRKGYLYLCTSFMQPEHKDPEDYWRFTKDGLATIVKNNKFKIIKIEGVHKYSQTIGWIIIEWAKTKNSFIYYPFRVFMKLFLYLLTKYSNTFIESAASGYRLLARKE